MPRISNIFFLPFRLGLTAVAITALVACSSNPVNPPPPTIPAAQPAASPPVTGEPPGTIWPIATGAHNVLLDEATGTLAVLTPGPEGQSAVALFPTTSAPRTVLTPGEVTAMTVGDGHLYLSTRGGYLVVDPLAGSVERVDVVGQSDTEFTAIARHTDGRLVLGTADGAVLTLDARDTVGASLAIFARVDALVAQGDTTVVLDRGQTSVTTVDAGGTKAAQALRAGDGATTMAADPMGRVLVADTRGGELLVFGTDPLIMRQRYPVPGAPYGLAASEQLAWVSQTATNTVIGYDLATGIPVEKVRHPTVRQPNSLAYDEASGTLYVVSGSGAGVQVIPDAAVSR